MPEIGPPSESTTNAVSTTGAGTTPPGQASSTVQTTSAPARNQPAIGIRSSGLREMTEPSSGPDATAPRTSRLSAELAAERDMPCASTRYGKPHSRPRTAGVDIVEKCVQNPSRVPGTLHAVATLRSTTRGDCGGSTGTTTPAGTSRSRANATAA